MAKKRKKADAVAEQDNSPVHTLVEQIRPLLLGGQYADGDRVEIEVMRDRLKSGGRNLAIKPSYMRAAFEELEEEGLIKILPKVGSVFCRPEKDEVRRIMGMRVALEAYVASRLFKFKDLDERIAKIAAHNERLQALLDKKASPEEYRKIDADFHEEIFRQTGQNRGIELLRKLRKWTASTVVRSFINEHLAAVIKEHDNIIKALRVAKPVSSSDGEHQEKQAVTGMANRISIEWAFREHLKNSVKRAFPEDPEPDPEAFFKYLAETYKEPDVQ